MNALAEPARTGVLVVEHDRAVRAVLSRLLEAEGLRALPAGGAAEAAELYRRHHDAVGLVLMDLRLRGADGRQALRLLRGIDPTVRCCLVSGAVAAGEEAAYLRQGFDAVLRKPFRPAEVAGVVRDLLSARAECVPGLTKTQAEDLLDWLASNGYPPGAVRLEEGGRFTVRYRRRAVAPPPTRPSP
jgi:CheY-like chemotaxis protein